MIALFKKSLADFKASFAEYISFELIYTFIASLLLVPFISYLFNNVFLLIGKGQALLNSEVYQLGFSFYGLMGMFAISFIAVTVLFIEFGTLIIIGQKKYFNQPVTIAQSFITAIKKLPKLLGFGVFQLFFLLLLVIPYLDASTLPPLFDINTNLLLRELLEQSILTKGIYIAIIIGVIYLYLRWIFTLHVIFIENKSITKSMMTSWRMTKQYKLRVILSLILMNAFFALVSFLVVTLISKFGIVIESKQFGDFIGNYLQLFASYLAIMLSLIFFPLNTIILTHLYYEVRKTDQDHLVLAESNFLSRTETWIKRGFNKRRGLVIFVAVIGIFGTVLVNAFVQSSIIYLPWDVEVAAHKGDGFDSPENSISAVESAIAKGVKIVEIDVTLTKDNVLVLNHDQDLTQYTNLPDKIRNLTYDEIKDVDIGSYFAEEYAGETIPTLDEVLALTSTTNTKVIIDVKTDNDEAIYADLIAKLVEKYETEELTIVQSFNQQLLKAMRERKEEIKLSQILYLYAGKLSNLDVDFYTVRETMLTKRFVKHAQSKNRGVWVWTVNRKKSIEKVLSYDIDGIITDYPERVNRIIGIKAKEDR